MDVTDEASMRSQGAGRIINITSMGGKLHTPLGAWYHGTKFALEAISDCLRLELQPFGIHVVVIEPGGIKTEWADIAAGIDCRHHRKSSNQQTPKNSLCRWIWCKAITVHAKNTL